MKRVFAVFLSGCLLSGCLDFSVRERISMPFYSTFKTSSGLLSSTGSLLGGDFFDENAVPNIVCDACSLPFYLVSDTILFPYDGYLFYNARCETEYFPEDGNLSDILQ